MNFRENLIDLIKKSHEYEYKEIAASRERNTELKPKFFFTKIQWVILFFSLIISVAIKGSIPSEFSGYIISGLALFVGVLFTFLITIYDKFNSIDFKQYHYNTSKEQYPIGTRLINYFKKITVLSLYATVISVFCILLLSINLLFSLDIVNVVMAKSISEIDLFFTFKVAIVLLYKWMMFYFLLDFILIVVYIISSFYDFMISEYNSVRLR